MSHWTKKHLGDLTETLRSHLDDPRLPPSVRKQIEAAALRTKMAQIGLPAEMESMAKASVDAACRVCQSIGLADCLGRLDWKMPCRIVDGYLQQVNS